MGDRWGRLRSNMARIFPYGIKRAGAGNTVYAQMHARAGAFEFEKCA